MPTYHGGPASQAGKYRAARTPGLNNQYLRSAVFELGKFPNSRAIPLLTGIVRSPNDTQDLKLFAVQSIGEIDPAGNRDLLRGLLRDNYVRYAAAEALAKTDDPSIIHDLEGMASREISPESRRRIQSLADTMRTRLIPR